MMAHTRTRLWIAVSALAVALSAAIATGTIGGVGYFPITRTFPLPWVVLGDGFLMSVVPAVLFCLWCRPLWHDEAIPRKRTAIAASLLASASAAWFVGGISYGLRYQGFQYTISTASGSLAFAVVIAALLRLSWRRQNPVAYSLAATFLLFVWTVTCAFPWLGEYP